MENPLLFSLYVRNQKFTAMKKLILILSFLSAQFINAQTGEIRGTVKDSLTGEPLIGANVYLYRNGIPIGTQTDIEGKYVIKPLDPGVYSVFIEAMGYQKKVVEGVKVTADKIQFIHVNLPLKFTDEFVVICYDCKEPLISPDMPGMKMIDESSIKLSPLNRDPLLLLTTITSDIKVSESGSKEIIIRGSRPNSSILFIENMKTDDFSASIPAIAIGNIKIYTGGIPARYGDFTGGVVAIEMKSYFDLISNLPKK